MRSLRTISFAVFGAIAPFAQADFSAQLAEASKPMMEGVPEVAVARLQALLKQNLSDTDWRAVAEQLLEAMAAANQTANADNLLVDPRLRHSPSANFWRAQLLASSHREAEALPLYRQVAADTSSPLRTAALFGAAEMLRALGRTDEALGTFTELSRDPKWVVRAQLRAAELYLDKTDAANARRLLEKVQPITSAEKKERHFLRGRLEMVLHRPDRAITIFESILKNPEGATHETLTAALFALADTHLQLNTPEAGDDALENFIEHRPSDVDLARIFAKLDQLYRAEKKPSRTELDRWARDIAQPRRAFAQWYLARFDLRLGRRDRALDSFAALRRTRPQLPALASAFLEFAQLELEERHFEDALAILNEALGMRPEAAVLDRVNFLAGQIQYHAKHFDAAIAGFEKIGHSDSALASQATFNAALSWLQKADEARFLASAEEFGNKTKDEKSRINLRLEAGLMEAAKRDPRAADSLRKFLREFPTAERVSEAWVALAELAFHATPPRLDEARKNLARAAESKPTMVAQERADYLTIWLEDATSGRETKVIELAKKFIQQHELSSLVPSVRMKLGEIYYRAEDFANAETQFQLLVEQNSTGPLTERALFFAGEAAMASMAAQSLDRALVLFDRVVQINGELKFAARNEQAVIERKLGKPYDALALYEEVLNGAVRPAEKREALCGKGDIFLEMAATDPQNYEPAIEAYDKLAADREAPAHWRNQALFKKGLCLEKKADRNGALATFYTVLDEGRRPDQPHEFFWFYKAGFNAGQLLEADAKWESAATIYEKLAAAGGTRADEARERLDRLRLEHFLRRE
ncbi:MAG TPA: tetratricopeptide repeat protein [Chthoniobacterales bacterium]|nr:tetratricopeptide repeat protein [Chthoniobacterales bacterium]